MVIIVCAALFLVYVAAGFLAAGPVLRSVLTQALTEHLHRETSIGAVRVNPLTFRVRVEDLAVAQREGEGAMVAFDLLDMRLHALSLFKLAPVLSHLRLVNPQVDVAFLGENEFSFSDLITPAQQAGEPHEGNATGESGGVFPFRVDNLAVQNGTVTFRDMPRKVTHVVSELDFSVPFTSSLRGDAEEYVEPSLKALVNGQHVAAVGKTKPFDKTLVTEFVFETEALDLARYWEYVPVKTPLRLVSGTCTAAVTMRFSRPDEEHTQMDVSGMVKLADVQVAAKGREQPVLGFSLFSVDVESFSLYEGVLAVREVRLESPVVRVSRDASGTLDWAGYLPSGTAGGEAEPSGPSLQVDVQRVAVRAGRVEWQDRSVPGGFSKRVQPVVLTATNLTTRKGGAAGVDLAVGDKERVTVKGAVSLDPVRADVEVAVSGVDLAAYGPYWAELLPLKVDSGVAGVALHVVYDTGLTAKQPDGRTAGRALGSTPDVRVSKAAVTLENLALRKEENKTPSVSLGRLAVTGGQMNLRERTASVEQVLLGKPEVRVVLYPAGLDLVEMFAGQDAAAAGGGGKSANGAGSGTGSGAGEDAAAWQARVDRFAVEEGRLAFVDRTLPSPGRIFFNNLKIDVEGVSTDLGQPLPLSLSAAVGGGSAERGNRGMLRVDGTVRPQPMDIQVRVRHENLPLAILDPYVGAFTDFMLAGGVLNADLENRVSQAGAEAPLQFASTGNARVNGLLLRDSADSSHVASFTSLEVQKYAASSAESRMRIEEVALNGLQVDARVDRDGVLNIMRLLRIYDGAEQAGGSGKDAKGQSPDAAAETGQTGQEGQMGQEGQAGQEGQEGQVGQEGQAGQAGQVGLTPLFRSIGIDRVRVNNGALRFTDRTLAPPFTSVMTELNVRLDGLSLADDARPAFDLTAKLDNQPLSLKGVANPLVVPVYSDLVLQLNGIDLVSLSPYALRSLGYPIERGRLYADVNFMTQDWVLKARNKIFLQQVRLGERDRSPGAPNIPVRLGLALLGDSAGNVEIDLPISGRLDDPQFLTGGIVFKAFVNLIFKAVTSPFALLGNIVGGVGGGGGGDAQYSVFDPGSARLNEGQLANLQTVVDFLIKKPAIRLEITGYADPQADAHGMVELGLLRAVQAARHDDLSRRERTAIAVEDVQVAPEEYVEYLTQAYKDAPEAENDPRPKGVFGFKDATVEEMEAFLRSRTTVGPADLEELASARARAVQEAILRLNPELAPRVSLAGGGRKAPEKAGVPAHRAELTVR